jgi:DNA-binding NarL/FixJ family response regulator
MAMTERPEIRVVVIDDHEMILQSLVRLLRDDPQMIVVGTALTAAEGIALTRQQNPDVVIIDYTLPDMDAPDAIVVLRDVDPEIKIITPSGSERPGGLYASIRAGSSGWVHKTRAIQELRDAVVNVAAGRPVANEELASLPGLDELVLHYQPIVALTDGRIVGSRLLSAGKTAPAGCFTRSRPWRPRRRRASSWRSTSGPGTGRRTN